MASSPPPSCPPAPGPPAPGVKAISSSWKLKQAATVLSIPHANNEWKHDNAWKFSAESITSIDPTQTKGSGVFFVVMKDQSCVVIKGSSTVGCDLFSHHLAEKFLKLSVPKTKVVSYLDTDTWDPMVQSLWSIEPKNPLSAEGRGSPLSKCLMRPFVTLIEFINGVDLEHVTTLGSILKDKEILREIGRIVAFDVLINNWDRLPCIWKNEGNPKNIMFSPGNKRVYAIDQILTCIDPNLHKINFERYKNEVQQLLSDVVTQHNPSSPYLFKTLQALTAYSGTQFGADEVTAIHEGFIEGTERIAQLTRHDLQQAHAAVHNQLKPTMDLLGLDNEGIGLNRINLDFLCEIVDLFKNAGKTPTLQL